MLFLGMAPDLSREERQRKAKIAATTVLCTLLVSAFLGNLILRGFGISLASFQIFGGIILAFLAFDMIYARTSRSRTSPEELHEAVSKDEIAVIPLGIPLLSGPGTISTVILSMERADGWDYRIGLILVLFVVALLVLICLRASTRLASFLGTTGVNLTTRLMGLIVGAMAVEFIMRGILTLMPALGASGGL